MKSSTRVERAWRAPLRSWLRRRVWPLRHDARPLILLLGGAAVAVLGYTGFRAGSGDESVSDAIYHAAQLFTLQASFTEPLPWQLEIARVLAPLLVGYAAVEAVLALFREQIELLHIRRFSGHVILAGLGEVGSSLALRLFEAGHRVTAVDLDPVSKTARRCSRRGIPIIRGDATDVELLDRMRLDRARYLVSTCGSDAVNVDVSLAARKVARQAGPLTVVAELEDLSLWRVLKTQALRASGSEKVRTEFFNVNELAARMLLERFPPRPAPVSPPAHLLLVGATQLSESLLLHAARGQGSEREVDQITVVGARARSFSDRLAAEHSDMRDLVRLSGVDLASPSALATTEMGGDADFGQSFVCLDDEAEGIKAAFWLSQRRDVHGQVVLALRGGLSGISHGFSVEGTAARVTTFGILEATLDPALLRTGTTEALAHAKHEAYVAKQLDEGVTPAENSSLVPWDRLPDSLKESNRRFADSIGDKLEQLGLVAVPLSVSVDGERGTDALIEPLMEEMAREEHDRWVRDLQRDGWQPTDGPKDPRRKLHPLLVPWADLSEAERDKDRQPIRALPALLEQAGFQIVSGGADPTPGDRAAADD